jgi:uncharacterized protein with NAD-binding domain and iron-sulfur cluster
MPDRVLVLGGGVAGMTAAHELAERGFQVTVIESRRVAGGKARSVRVPHPCHGGRTHLPGEHGFRFFPGFYQHLPDTMKRIPYRDNSQGVFDNLATTTHVELAQENLPALVLPARFPHSRADLHLIAHDIFHDDTGLSLSEKSHFGRLLLKLLTSCEERRHKEYEYQSWWEFSGADEHGPAYKNFLADGLTRTLVAARARHMSARTGGYILLQLLLGMSDPDVEVDRVLVGPTNDVWIDPWLAHLQELGVDYQFGDDAREFQFAGGRITGVVVGSGPERRTLTADHYVAAMPVEHMAHMVTPQMKEAAPHLAGLDQLVTRWMNGIQFYLHEDVPIVHGHTIYVDSPWSLTSISQRQFWPAVDFTGFGDGTVRGVLSVDISEWETEGLNGKRAMDCNKDEIRDEVWAQLKAHLTAEAMPVLDDRNLADFFLDEAVRFPKVRAAQQIRTDINLEPLLVNTPGSWDNRPEAVTAIENLVVASDYVRTHTDLACMEGANEAARRAVNGILERTGSREPPCEVWKLHEPRMYGLARMLDEHRFRHGKPHEPPADEDLAPVGGAPTS